MASVNAGEVYFGTYATFHTVDEKTGSVLIGPDVCVGDRGTLEWDLDEKKRERVWLVNPYGARIGYLDPNVSNVMAVYKAKGWTLSYIFSFAAYTQKKDQVDYWGQVALVAYNPRYEDEFEAFIKRFAELTGDGKRPDPELGKSGVESVLHGGASSWASHKVEIPIHDKHTTLIKDRRTAHDQLLDKARQGNKGCYAASYIFIALLVVFVILVLHWMGLF
jgi:hypothetical protein